MSKFRIIRREIHDRGGDDRPERKKVLWNGSTYPTEETLVTIMQAPEPQIEIVDRYVDVPDSKVMIDRSLVLDIQQQHRLLFHKTVEIIPINSIHEQPSA
jgi:hypothetical protein